MTTYWRQYLALWRMAFDDRDLLVMFGARCLILTSHAVVVAFLALALAGLARL